MVFIAGMILTAGYWFVFVLAIPITIVKNTANWEPILRLALMTALFTAIIPL